MTTVIAPAGLVPLQAPLPSPRSYDLLSTLEIREPAEDRWLGGAWTGGYVPGPAFTHDPCSSGSDRVKTGAGQIHTQRSFAFTVYVPGFCTAASIGPDPGYWTERLKDVFRIYESAAVERTLATGDGHGVLGPYLADENMEVLHGGLALEPVESLGLLEQAVARHGNGLIHAGPRTFTAWKAANLVWPDGPVMRTYLGTPVIVGYGYVGIAPAAAPPPLPTQEWAFASGPVEVIRTPEVTTIPANYAEALDRSLNDVLFLAERPYLLNWLAREDQNDNDHTQAGVLVDLASLASSFVVIGGGGATYTIETPAGLVNGVNAVFTLSMTPVPASGLLLWKNGLFMRQGDDYTLAGQTITFAAGQIPPVGSNLVAGVPS